MRIYQHKGKQAVERLARCMVGRVHQTNQRHVGGLQRFGSPIQPLPLHSAQSQQQCQRQQCSGHRNYRHHLQQQQQQNYLQRQFGHPLSASNRLFSTSSDAPKSMGKIHGTSNTDGSDNGNGTDKKKQMTKDDDGGMKFPDQEMETKLAKIQTEITHKYQQGNYREALKQSKDLLKRTEKHFGRQHPATASAYNNCGLFSKLLGDFIPARQNYSQAQRIYGKVVGRDHASYALTLHNLGTLNQSQVHFDTTLKATERLGLVEKALEYFQEALEIRTVELGEAHPHTLATKSAYGSTLAAQVLHQHKLVEDDEKAKKAGALGSGGGAIAKQYISLNPESLTRQAWDAAETHLRGAVQTAIANPRGQSIRKKAPRKKAPPKKDTKIHTLSAASAGQHLAIFLKSRAMTSNPYDDDKLKEARTLYNEVLAVRTKLLPQGHPDLYATQFSLAELLDAEGDEEAANAMRQEILDTFDPVEEEETEEEVDDETKELPNVIIEQTKGN